MLADWACATDDMHCNIMMDSEFLIALLYGISTINCRLKFRLLQ